MRIVDSSGTSGSILTGYALHVTAAGAAQFEVGLSAFNIHVTAAAPLYGNNTDHLLCGIHDPTQGTNGAISVWVDGMLEASLDSAIDGYNQGRGGTAKIKKLQKQVGAVKSKMASAARSYRASQGRKARR